MRQSLTSFCVNNGRLKRVSAYCAILALAIGLAAIAPPSPSAQGGPLLSRFELSESSFSPDGNGAQELTEVYFTLVEDSPEVSVVVFRSDSVSVVDTLFAAGPASAGADTAVWDGTDQGGGAVPEGLYLVTVSALGSAARDTSVTLPVAVDKTPPSIQVLLSEPGIYAPGLTGTPQVYGVTFRVSDSSPTYGLPTLADQLNIEMFDVNGAPVVLDTFVDVIPDYTGQDGIYEFTWDANLMQSVTDGYYRIEFVLTDKAGHRASASDRANVDLEKPDVGFLNVDDGEDFITLPDSLFGWAWDRNGIDSLYVKYEAARPYWLITDARLVSDTTFFAIPLADSIPGEGSYRLGIRAKDGAEADTGRVATRGLQFSVDLSAPPPPTLDPFTGIWRNPSFELGGTWAGSPDVIRFYRNGTQVDSVFTIILEAKGLTRFAPVIELENGVNTLTATAVDEALNESALSNEVRVEFEDDSGLYIPAPFTRNDEFHLNLRETADRATLRIYDLSGDLVVILTKDFPSRNYAFRWDGLNGGGEDVKKGPLVAVSEAEVDGSTAGDAVFREVFLFDPDR